MISIQKGKKGPFGRRKTYSNIREEVDWLEVKDGERLLKWMIQVDWGKENGRYVKHVCVIDVELVINYWDKICKNLTNFHHLGSMYYHDITTPHV